MAEQASLLTLTLTVHHTVALHLHTVVVLTAVVSVVLLGRHVCVTVCSSLQLLLSSNQFEEQQQ
jgi:hypothetical protein